MFSFITLKTNDSSCASLIKEWASEEEHEEAKRKIDANKACEFLLARVALRKLLAQKTGQKDWKIEKEPSGKPFVVANGTRGPFVSISHTRGLVAAALSTTGSIGIDVEYWRERDFMGLANFAFGPKEVAEVQREGASAFYKLWTLKEAIAKATGAGIWAPTPLDAIEHKDVHLHYELLAPDYSLAIAVLHRKDVYFVK